MKHYKIKYYVIDDGRVNWRLFTNPMKGGGSLVCQSKMFANLGQAKKSAREVFHGQRSVTETAKPIRVFPNCGRYG